MTEQRVPFSIREEALSGLKDWYADRIDKSFCNQICGNTNEADTRYTGNQATVAPSSTTGNTRWIFPTGDTVETDLSSSTSHQMTLSLIDFAVATAKEATPQVRPVKVNGDSYYVLMLDTWQAKNLRTTYTSGAWGDLQKAAIQGGEITKSPIFTGALGVYGGVILHETTRLYAGAFGDGGSRGARAVLCGAQSCALAYGQDAQQGGDRMSWFEELFDYGNQLGVSAGMIWGLKKTLFNSIDFGTIALSTSAVRA